MMQYNLSEVNVLFPETISWDVFEKYSPLAPFDADVVEFLGLLSTSLLKDKESRLYPDVITFAFFCRKGSVNKLKERYADDSLRLGRGIVFHIGPSNVPVNFAYSLVAGLLAGNCNIVRCSSKNFPQVDLIVRHIGAVASSIPSVAKRMAIVRYGHESQANDYFSSICQVRVIWGGDETVYRLRQSKTSARTFDVTFADRYSFAVINADKLIEEENLTRLAEKFYNDTYLFDQNACSAPHLVVWLGSPANISAGKAMFWKTEYDMVRKKQYHFESVMAIDKLVDFYKQSIAMNVSRTSPENNELFRVHLNSPLPDCIDDYRGKCGYFTEYDARSLDEIIPAVKYKYQTMACYGIAADEIRKFVCRNHPIGIDRIVPFGETATFSLIWDGYNLIDVLSRNISVIENRAL